MWPILFYKVKQVYFWISYYPNTRQALDVSQHPIRPNPDFARLSKSNQLYFDYG
jgi:hypothetical protein